MALREGVESTPRNSWEACCDELALEEPEEGNDIGGGQNDDGMCGLA